MTAVQRLYRLTWGGRLYDVEEWTNGLWIETGLALEQAPENYLTALTAWMNQNGAQHNAGCSLDFIKFNEINPTTGRFLDQTASHTFNLPTPVESPSSSPSLPQAALVISLATQVVRGRASKSRLFVPVSDQGFDGTGRISEVIAQSAATAAADMIGDVNAASVEGDVVVFSRLTQQVNVVTSVRVGRVVDTQRRRRSNLDEDYQSAPVL